MINAPLSVEASLVCLTSPAFSTEMPWLTGTRRSGCGDVVVSIRVKVAAYFFLKWLSLFLCKSASWAGKMAEWIKMLAAQIDDLRYPRDPYGGENLLLEVVLGAPLMRSLTHSHTKLINIKEFKEHILVCSCVFGMMSYIHILPDILLKTVK